MSAPTFTSGEKGKSPDSSLAPSSASRPAGRRTESLIQTESKVLPSLQYSNECLEATGVKPLEAPGPESNYHQCQFVMGTIIRGSSFGYVLRENQLVPLPASEEHDRCKVSALIL
ncbi:uncharacterized protein MELLADRAFT_103678 [Melampsora larici-populina 98AG31]|uniref:Uncharacterized protein n=1 Tax=Melampsora larici-populina (strain 98AG31 / pathotype 3-4-7) TaxID=747676 RepID=F4RC41_MELLP|nr:uncharacterized protein MELLADRAFT_103678 [Melampsora larici-populina 98AG31]EGG10211.1 hypothetical protein MELLADRAFT_103678 [Melampsora larici-populina 98AG31]